MAVFKCKMCGATIENINENARIVECDSCGVSQTLSCNLSNSKIANMYDRANHFRMNNEFDKAMSIYEQILNEDRTDAEAHWSIMLCRFGVTYVEDPRTRRRIPTINRMQHTPILLDTDYKAALEYADEIQKPIYKEQATEIDKIQKRIFEIASKEKPFDVFICYKESDEQGVRTRDSVLAQDLYYALTNEGFKVFFARITLESKLGSAYEPCIFSALQSSKVMVVLGTKTEHFNAVWVKNEWSRYLALMKNDKSKSLIPAYKDMDPYDLPEEFSYLQALDMSKIGFIQDLLHGIKKLVKPEVEKPIVKEAVVIENQSYASKAVPLLKRGFIFLEDGKVDSANEYFEKSLDEDPENADAYLGKLLILIKARKPSDLSNININLDCSDEYNKAYKEQKELLNKMFKYATPAQAEKYKGYLFERAINIKNRAMEKDDYQMILKARDAFRSIYLDSYGDSEKFAEECIEDAKENKYSKALKVKEEAKKNLDIDGMFKAQKLFEDEFLQGYKNSAQMKAECHLWAQEIQYTKALNIKINAEKSQKANKPEQFDKAKELFCSELLQEYKNSEELAKECETLARELKYNKLLDNRHNALRLLNCEMLGNVISALSTEFRGYKDSEEQLVECQYVRGQIKMKEAKDRDSWYTKSNSYEEAYDDFCKLDDYKDSKKLAKKCKKKYRQAKTLDAIVDFFETVWFGIYEMFEYIWDGLCVVVPAIGKGIAFVFVGLWKVIKFVFSGIWKFMKNHKKITISLVGLLIAFIIIMVISAS